MTLRVAVQMDPIESINIHGDSSFALMLAAQERGYRVYHYDVNALTLDANDRLTAVAHPVAVQRVAGSICAIKPRRCRLGSALAARFAADPRGAPQQPGDLVPF